MPTLTLTETEALALVDVLKRATERIGLPGRKHETLYRSWGRVLVKVMGSLKPVVSER